MPNETSITATRDGNSYVLSVTVQIPSPSFGLSGLGISFPPSLPDIKLPGLPPALTALATIIEGLASLLQKFLSAIPDATINLKVKVGSITVIDAQLNAPL